MVDKLVSNSDNLNKIDKMVKLKHFVENLHKELNNFEKHWINKQKTDGNITYPDRLEVWDWLDELECYNEMHGTLFQDCLDSEAEISERIQENGQQ